MPNHKTYGFSLIELLTTITIALILGAIAVPSFSNYMSDARVVGAAEKIKSDMEWARTLAIRKNSSVAMKFQSSATGWCYGFDDTDNTCDCSNNSCTIDSVTKTINNQPYEGTELNITMDNGTNSILLSSRGMVNTQGIITVTSGAKEARVIINPLGRAHICSNQLRQFKNCN